MIVGNPGRIVGWVDEKGNKLVFDKNGKSKCNKFSIKGDVVTKIS